MMRLILLFPALILMSFNGASESDRLPIGIVDRVDGRWQRVQDRQPLVRGDLLFDDETVTIEHAESGSLVVLLLNSDGASWRQNCPCDGSYRPPGDQKSGFWAFLSNFWSEGHHLPEVTLGSRGIESGMLQDAVVVRTGRFINLAPAMGKVAPGSYRLKLTPAPDSESAKLLIPHELHLNIAEDKAAQFEGVESGLYIATLSRVGDYAAENKLLLVAGESDHALLNKWAQIEKTMMAWSKEHPDTAKILIARALYSLDAEYPAGH